MKTKFRLLSVLLALLLLVCLPALASCKTATDNTATPSQTAGTAAGGLEAATSGSSDEAAPVASGFTVTFATDDRVAVTVYRTQEDLTNGENGEETTVAYTRDGTTGELTQDGTGQISFLLTFAEGYTLDSISIAETDGYNNLKGSADTGVANGYRITKITSDLTVTVTAKEETAAEDPNDGYEVTFVLGEHVSVTVYRTQDLTTGGENTTVAYSRESGTGTLTRTDGQVNFVLVFDEGYELDGEMTIAGSYKNLKDLSADGTPNAYRITKIASDLTITVNAKASA